MATYVSVPSRGLSIAALALVLLLAGNAQGAPSQAVDLDFGCGSVHRHEFYVYPGDTSRCHLIAFRGQRQVPITEARLTAASGNVVFDVPLSSYKGARFGSITWKRRDSGKRFHLIAQALVEGSLVRRERNITVGSPVKVVEVIKEVSRGVPASVYGQGAIVRPLELFLSFIVDPKGVGVMWSWHVSCLANGVRSFEREGGRGTNAGERRSGVIVEKLPVPKNADRCSIEATGETVGPRRARLELEVLGRRYL